MARRKRIKPDSELRQDFLGFLELTANVTLACNMCGLSRKTAYNWRSTVEGFADAWDASQEVGTDALEDEAIRRASNGTMKKKFTGKGEAVIDPETGEQYIEHEYSDTLLIFMLKARRPDKFKDRIDARLGGIPGQPLEVIEIVRHKEKPAPLEPANGRITITPPVNGTNGNGKH